MTDTDVVDWRVWKAATVAADAGIAKAGDQIYVSTKLEASVHGPFSFITPSPISLALVRDGVPPKVYFTWSAG